MGSDGWNGRRTGGHGVGSRPSMAPPPIHSGCAPVIPAPLFCDNGSRLVVAGGSRRPSIAVGHRRPSRPSRTSFPSDQSTQATQDIIAPSRVPPVLAVVPVDPHADCQGSARMAAAPPAPLLPDQKLDRLPGMASDALHVSSDIRTTDLEPVPAPGPWPISFRGTKPEWR